jgi:hypothetical protein
MSQLGFPGWNAMNRRTVRAPVNPLDKATVISIYPMEVKETKITVQPGVFTIPPGSYENPSILVVGPSSWWREIDPEQPLLEIPVASILMADSIVRDYCNGILGCNMGSSMPGLFYVPGTVTVDQVKKDYKSLLDIANKKQRAWFEELVKMADIAWARTQGNPLSVNELNKIAAATLGIEDREWLKAYKAVNQVKCFACGTFKNPLYPVCPACRAIDPNHAAAKDIKFAVA